MATLNLSYTFDQQGFMNDKDFYANDPDVYVYRTPATYHLVFHAYDETSRTAETAEGAVHLNDLVETAIGYAVTDRIE